MLSSMFLIFWKRVCLGMRKLVQWRKKCIVDSISLPHWHKWFKVSWKKCLDLCSWRWLRPRRNLVKSLIPRGLWISRKLFAQGRIKCRSFFLKVLRHAEFLMGWSKVNPRLIECVTLGNEYQYNSFYFVLSLIFVRFMYVCMYVVCCMYFVCCKSLNASKESKLSMILYQFPST